MDLLIITLGNSDVQFYKPDLELMDISSKITFRTNTIGHNLSYELATDDGIVINLKGNRNYPEWLTLVSSRTDGQAAAKNIQLFTNLFKFPLISPVLKFLNDEGHIINKVVLVCTDQMDKKFQFNDTIYIKEIISDFLQKCPVTCNAFLEVLVIKHVTDIDTLYPAMRENVILWRKEISADATVFLADQGGVDQINQSLRLQCLHVFKNKLRIIQKAEEVEAKFLDFPQLFLKDLAKQNIIKHVTDYDFDKIDDTLQPESWVVLLCNYAAQRLALNGKGASKTAINVRLALKGVNTFFGIPEWDWVNIDELYKNKIKIRDLWVSAKIQYQNNRYSEFLWRLFTIAENMYAEPFNDICECNSLDKFYLRENIKKEDKNEGWENQLNEVDADLIPHLIKTDIWLNNPNRYAYDAIFRFLFDKGRLNPPLTISEFDFITKVLKGLAGKRHAIAHSMSSISEKDLRKLLKIKENDFFTLMDKWFEIDRMGEFGKYRSFILQHYD